MPVMCPVLLLPLFIRCINIFLQVNNILKSFLFLMTNFSREVYGNANMTCIVCKNVFDNNKKWVVNFGASQHMKAASHNSRRLLMFPNWILGLMIPTDQLLRLTKTWTYLIPFHYLMCLLLLIFMWICYMLIKYLWIISVKY